MGKGDMKTRRGKISRGTHGVRRPKNKNVHNHETETSKK